MKQKSRPIERITNLLGEIEELRDWIRLALSEFPHTHPIPPPVASTWERAIRSARSRTESEYISATHDHMMSQRRSRIRLEENYRMRSQGQFGSLSPSQMAAIEAEIEATSEGDYGTAKDFLEYDSKQTLPTADDLFKE